MKNIHRINRKIYITNSEEIKFNDYITDGYKVWKWKDDCSLLGRKKVILTDDPDLIADGVQAIDDEFLDWFVKNPSCEFVEVNRKQLDSHYEFFEYKITIPKEQQKQYLIDMMRSDEELGLYDEPKQETLEEVAERYADIHAEIFDLTKYSQLPYHHNDRNKIEDAVEFGAKWQQQQSNENSWFNEYQEVENYIIKKIGDRFLEATPEKYNTASQATIALLENNWQQQEQLKSTIDRLQEKYDENGYDCSLEIKLQRIENHFDSTIKIYQQQNKNLYSQEEVDFLINLLRITTEYEVLQSFRDKVEQFKKK